MFTFEVGKKNRRDEKKVQQQVFPIKKPPRKECSTKLVIPPQIYTFLLKQYSPHQEILILGYASHEEDKATIEWVQVAAEGEVSYVSAEANEVNECILDALEDGCPEINVHIHTQPSGTYPSATDFDCYHEWTKASPNDSRWYFAIFANGFVYAMAYHKESDGSMWYADIDAYIEGSEESVPRHPKSVVIQKHSYPITPAHRYNLPPSDPFERVLYEIRIGTYRPASDIGLLANVAVQCASLYNQDVTGFDKMLEDLFDAIVGWEETTKRTADDAMAELLSAWSEEPVMVEEDVEKYFNGEMDIYQLMSKMKYGTSYYGGGR